MLLEANTGKKTVLMFTINLYHIRSAQDIFLIVIGNYFQRPEVPSI